MRSLNTDPISPVQILSPQPPPLPEGLAELLRALRLPHIRSAAPKVLATATAPGGGRGLRILVRAEVAGRAERGDRQRRPSLGPSRRQDAFDARD